MDARDWIEWSGIAWRETLTCRGGTGKRVERGRGNESGKVNTDR